MRNDRGSEVKKRVAEAVAPDDKVRCLPIRLEWSSSSSTSVYVIAVCLFGQAAIDVKDGVPIPTAPYSYPFFVVIYISLMCSLRVNAMMLSFSIVCSGDDSLRVVTEKLMTNEGALTAAGAIVVGCCPCVFHHGVSTWQQIARVQERRRSCRRAVATSIATTAVVTRSRTTRRTMRTRR